jgi:hypothetical protein
MRFAKLIESLIRDATRGELPQSSSRAKRIAATTLAATSNAPSGFDCLDGSFRRHAGLRFGLPRTISLLT